MNERSPGRWATLGEQLGWLRQFCLNAVAKDDPRHFLQAAGFVAILAAVALGVLAGGLLGWVAPTHVDGLAVAPLPKPPTITQAERRELARIAPEFDAGLPPLPFRTWDIDTLPSAGLFAVKPRSTPYLRSALTFIQQAAAADSPARDPEQTLLQAAQSQLDEVEKIEGKDRAVVLYHSGLISILNKGPADPAVKSLTRALSIIERDLKKNPGPAMAARAAGVRAAIDYALGQVELRRSRPKAAEAFFVQALSEAVKVRSYADARSQLFAMDPRTTVVDYNSAQLWAALLRASQKANDVPALEANLAELGKESPYRWSSRSHLAVTAQLVAADRGLFPLVQSIQPTWADGDPQTWRDLSDQARYVAGEKMSPPPLVELQPWATIRADREKLSDGPTLDFLNEAMGRDSFLGQPPLVQAWRDETAADIGDGLLKDGLAGSANAADRFIIAAHRMFPARIKWEAAGRRFFFGLRSPWRFIVAAILFLAAMYPIFLLFGVRTSYRLTFHHSHARDRERARLPKAIQAARQAQSMDGTGKGRVIEL